MSRMIVVVLAFRNGKGMPRPMRGLTSRTRWRRAWKYSTMTAVDELGDAAGQVVGVVEEHAERLHLQPLALLAQLAVGGDGAGGATRHEVADAGAAVAQQVRLVDGAALDLEGVVGMVARP